MSENKPYVGVYRTAFPLVSETFIVEQMRAMRAWKPVAISRDYLGGGDEFKHIELSKQRGRFDAFCFSAFGSMRGFVGNPKLSQLHLIHAHFAPDGVLAQPIAQHLGIPLVVTCHGSDVTVSDTSLLKSGRITNFRWVLGREKLFAGATKFIAVSDFLRETMLAKGFPPEKTIKHYVGVDIDRFRPISNPSSDRAPYFLSVARHTEVKGLDVLLEAFALVVKKHPAVRLVQIGNGGITQQLKLQTKRLGLENNVEFLGALPSAQVLPFIQNARALVLSSRRAENGAEEAFGLVLAEASACGVPCIGTRVGGIPEAMIPGDTGFIVEPEAPTALAECMTLLLTDIELAHLLGQKGREYVADKFSLARQTAILEDMYSELAE